MIELVFIAWGLGAGMPLAIGLALGVVVMAPMPAAFAIFIHLLRSRPRPTPRAALFCEAMAGELRAGAVPRAALGAAARSVSATALAEAADAGAPMPVLARLAASEFHEIARELEVVLSGWTGASLFDELAGLSLAHMEVAGEVTAATAAARATSIALLLAPGAVVAWGLAGKDLSAYLATGPQRVAAAAGVALMACGLAIGTVMTRRAA